MTWVRSEYAGELAVLSTWLCALVPWSFSFGSRGGITVVALRFQYVMVQFIFGLELSGFGEQPVLPVWAAPAFAAPGTDEARAYLAWAAAAALLTVAVVVSIAYYLREDRVEAGPVDPVRLLGGLLVLVGGLEAAAVGLLWRGYVLTTVPLGVVFCLALGGVLLRVDRT